MLRLHGGNGEPAREERCAAAELSSAAAPVWRALASAGLQPAAVGHRIVHGGPLHLEPALVEADLMSSLRAATPFAPLHLPGELALIEAVVRHAPGVPQVACFDTAFHAGMPLVARRLPLPTSLDAEGVRRYGFHGLSYESIVGQLGPLVAGRLVVAHLGNGASMVALRDGAPLDTTMGLTPAGGLVMGTRTGDLDPGVVIHLARTRGMDAEALRDLLYRRSGLLALAETTSDMQALLAARAEDPRAELAVAVFCHSARKWIGALAAVLGGLDGLVFTGGIGQHAAVVRAEICATLAHLGIELDAERNSRAEAVISAGGSRCTVRVLATDEERVVARHTARLALAGVAPAQA